MPGIAEPSARGKEWNSASFPRRPAWKTSGRRFGALPAAPGKRPHVLIAAERRRGGAGAAAARLAALAGQPEAVKQGDQGAIGPGRHLIEAAAPATAHQGREAMDDGGRIAERPPKPLHVLRDRTAHRQIG